MSEATTSAGRDGALSPGPFACSICGSGRAEPYEAREMMFGTRDRFAYGQCSECGCLQIASVPEHLERYYPAGYYSLGGAPARGSRVFQRLRAARNRSVITGRGTLGRLLAAASNYPFPAVREWLTRTGTTERSRILDVGCGTGQLLADLGGAGFRHLLGVDPFIDADIRHAAGARVIKGTIHQLDGAFDLVMFHHSLEHIPDQVGTLASAGNLLADDGWCLVRVPTVSSEAWERYRTDWVQLDAPRHLFVHSVESMRRLGERAGLVLREVVFDSTEFQFTGSELYRRDVPLSERGRHPFSAAELRRFRREADELNARGRGDQAAFYFTKKGPGAGRP